MSLMDIPFTSTSVWNYVLTQKEYLDEHVVNYKIGHLIPTNQNQKDIKTNFCPLEGGVGSKLGNLVHVLGNYWVWLELDTTLSNNHMTGEVTVI